MEKENAKQDPQKHSKISKIARSVSKFASNLDFFKVQPYFCLEGNSTSASMCGGVVTLIIISISIYLAGYPFQDSYISSMDLMDDKVFNFTGSQHQIAINVTLPPGSPDIGKNISVNYGCTYSMFGIEVYFYQTESEPCEIGDYCLPKDFQCPLYSFLNKSKASIVTTVSVCTTFYTPDCDPSLVSSLGYVNVSLAQTSDQVSFTQASFDRRLMKKSFDIQNPFTLSLMQQFQLNYFKTNTYFKGIFGIGGEQLSSIRQPQSFIFTQSIIASFIGYDEGQALFTHTLRLSHTSKEVVIHFPIFTEWISQIVSFISIITVTIGFFLNYYEKNIMLLILSSHDSYAIEDDQTETNFRQNSFKTIFAALLYRPWFVSRCPKVISQYYKNHWKALQRKYEEIDIKNFFDDLKKIASDSNEIIKIDLDNEDENLEQQQKEPKTFQDLQTDIKAHIQNNQQRQINITQLEPFLGFIKIQNFDYKKALYAFEVLFGTKMYDQNLQFQLLREEYIRYHNSAFKNRPFEVYFLKSEDMLQRGPEGFAKSMNEINIKIQQSP